MSHVCIHHKSCALTKNFTLSPNRFKLGWYALRTLRCLVSLGSCLSSFEHKTGKKPVTFNTLAFTRRLVSVERKSCSYIRKYSSWFGKNWLACLKTVPMNMEHRRAMHNSWWWVSTRVKALEKWAACLCSSVCSGFF